jgi:very-short-patch-repair endonuclease
MASDLLLVTRPEVFDNSAAQPRDPLPQLSESYGRDHVTRAFYGYKSHQQYRIQPCPVDFRCAVGKLVAELDRRPFTTTTLRKTL